MWGLSPSDDNAQINAYKAQYGITNPCAGTQGGGPAAIDTTIEGQNFLGYPTFCIVCPDKTLYFDVCYPPEVPCFDPYFELCAEGTLAAHFTSDVTEVCAGIPVHYFDQSTGSIVSWEWLFPGGSPLWSTEQNPVVTYQNPGRWDVSLTVSDGVNSSTSEIEGYMHSFALPDVTLSPFEDVCENDAAFPLTGGSPEGGTYSGNGVANGWFYPANAGVGIDTIVYTYTDINGCTDSSWQTIVVDPCPGVRMLEEKDIMIYPNPSKGTFNIRIHSGGKLLIEVMDMPGAIIYKEEGYSTGEYNTSLKLNNSSKGIYILIINTNNGNIARKICTY